MAEQETVDEDAKWTFGNPPKYGYYLATWLAGVERVPTVSELWFNDSKSGAGRWWRTRGYLSERSDGLAGEVKNVIAWMPMPLPAPPTT